MNNRTRSSAVLLALVGFGVSAIAASSAITPTQDWPQWRGPSENGISLERLPDKPKFDNVVWKKSVGTGFSSVAVADGRIYTMGHRGPKEAGEETVWCFDAVTGREIWTQTYPAPLLDRFYEGGPGATPTVRQGKVYTYSKHGRVHCYRADTGSPVWQRDMLAESGLEKPPEWGFAPSPYFLNDQTLLIEAGNTYALDAATGKVLWKSERFTPAYGTPKAFKAGDRNLVAVMKTEGLVILDASNGKTVATAEWQTAFDTTATTPIIEGNRIFISSGYDRGCALFELMGDSLKKVYESKSMCNHMNNSVLLDGHLDGFDGTAHRGRPTHFVCIELATGKEKWRAPVAEALGCGAVMAAAGGMLLILSERGELLSVPATPQGFKATARAQAQGGRCWTVPVLAHGRIYCRNSRGDLVCVRPE